jgi:hypothetical protein
MLMAAYLLNPVQLTYQTRDEARPCGHLFSDSLALCCSRLRQKWFSNLLLALLRCSLMIYASIPAAQNSYFLNEVRQKNSCFAPQGFERFALRKRGEQQACSRADRKVNPQRPKPIWIPGFGAHTVVYIQNCGKRGRDPDEGVARGQLPNRHPGGQRWDD